MRPKHVPRRFALFALALFALATVSLLAWTSPARASTNHLWVGTFIDRTFLEPRDSVLTGNQFVMLRDRYHIPIIDALIILKIESNLGSPNWATAANNFGCVKWYASRTAIMGEPTPGRVWHWSSWWYRWRTPAEGMNGWGHFIANWGNGWFLDRLRHEDWTAVARVYNGGSSYAGYLKTLHDRYTAIFRATGEYPLTTADWTP